MTIEQFNAADYLPRGYYPWPDIENPLLVQIGKEMDKWIDTDYAAVWPEQVRNKYKKMILHDVTARISPTLDEIRIRPVNRFMLWLTSFDDQHELFSVEELEQQRRRTMEILAGSDPAPGERGWFKQLALVRDEYKAIMPASWFRRFVQETSDFMQYGMGGEAPFKKTKRIPSLAHYLVFREYSIGMRPFLVATELELEYALPEDIACHPVLRRLLALAARLVAHQNDIHSLRKEYGKDTETLNLVLVLQHECSLSLEEACIEAMRIHDADMAEFVSLQHNLPDFKAHHKIVEKYIMGLGTMVQGVNTYYLTGTQRYLIRGAGFAWPEHANK